MNRRTVFFVAVAAWLVGTATPAAASDDAVDSNDSTDPTALTGPTDPTVPGTGIGPGTDRGSSAPTLVRFVFDGRTYFKEETLLTFVASRLDEPVDEELLHKDAAAIADQYRARGYLRAVVDVATVPVDALVTPGGRAVFARFDIRAGERAEIKAVHVVGNVLLDEATLKDGLFARPPEPLGAVTRAGLFHRPYLDQDQQRIVYNYYKHGFLEARVVDTRVTASSDLGGLAVTFAVAEGPRYELSGVTFAGELPAGATSQAWRERVVLKDGDTADLVALNQQTEPLLDAWREQGFPFARFEQQLAVTPPVSGSLDKKGIAVTLKVVRGPDAVVRSVRITGNKGTMDHVLRREVVVVEGTRYDHKAVKLSEKQLLQTGLLLSAQGRAIPIDDGGSPAIPQDAEAPTFGRPPKAAPVDVEFTVAETTTWLLSPAGYGDANEGFIFVLVAGDRNLFGTGLQTFGSFQWSKLRTLFDVSLTEPRLLGTRSTATLEVHRRELRYRDFRTLSQGGGSGRANYAHELGFRLGGPARLFAGGGVGIEFGGVVADDERPLAATTLLPQNVFRNVVELRAGFDTREGGLSPRNGVLISVDAATAGPWTASGLSFVDGQANVRMFWSPLADITLKSNTQAGLIGSPLGTSAPVTDRYFLGGLGTVRGFFPRSIGPLVPAPLVDGTVVDVLAGGVVKFVQNVEVEAPVWPGLPLRVFGFVDAGNAFSEVELQRQLSRVDRATASLPLNLLWSTGFGVLIETPVLPFRFEWSVPLTRRSFDQPLNFFLGVGSAF